MSAPPDALAALRFASAQVSASALASHLEADAQAAIATARARWAASSESATGAASAADAASADALLSARRAAAGIVPPKRGRPPGRKSDGGAARRATLARVGTGAGVVAMDDGSAITSWPASPRALAAAVVAGRRSALAAAAPVAAPPPPPSATAWPNPRLPPGSSARLTPWPALRVPLPARPLPALPASDGRRAGRAEPLWWPPPGSGARRLGAGSAPGSRLLSGGAMGGAALVCDGGGGGDDGDRCPPGAGPQRDAEAALASSREFSRADDAIAPSPAPFPRPPPGWAGPTFAVRRSRVAGLGLYILVPAAAGAYLLDYSGTVVRGAGVADARERAYTDAAAGGWCEGTYMFNCGPAAWGHGGGSGGGVDHSSMCGCGGDPPTLVVDATQAGSAARFINHSCAPNCVAIVEPPALAWSGGGGGAAGTADSPAAPGAARGGAAVAAGLPRVALYAARALVPGEELFFEYRLSPPGPGDPELVCGCGAAGCRGVL